MSVLNNLKERTNAQISEIQACTSFDKAKIDARQIETLNIVSELIDFVSGTPPVAASKKGNDSKIAEKANESD